MSESPKLCPFCLSYDIQFAIDNAQFATYYAHETEYVFAYCADCGARGPIATSYEDAVRYWNDRPEEEE